MTPNDTQAHDHRPPEQVSTESRERFEAEPSREMFTHAMAHHLFGLFAGQRGCQTLVSGRSMAREVLETEVLERLGPDRTRWVADWLAADVRSRAALEATLAELLGAFGLAAKAMCEFAKALEGAKRPEPAAGGCLARISCPQLIGMAVAVSEYPGEVAVHLGMDLHPAAHA